MAEQPQSGATTWGSAPASDPMDSACFGRRGAALLAIFCACMVLFAATLRLAHSHTAAEQDSGRCQICSSIHTAAPAAAAPVQIILHAAPEPVVASAPKSVVTARVATLSDRAPPTLPEFPS